MMRSRKSLCCAFIVLVAVCGLCVGQRNADLLEIPEVSRDEIICFALYTVHENVLKLTAQLYPLADGDDRQVRLEVKKDGTWTEIARTTVI